MPCAPPTQRYACSLRLFHRWQISFRNLRTRKRVDLRAAVILAALAGIASAIVIPASARAQCVGVVTLTPNSPPAAFRVGVSGPYCVSPSLDCPNIVNTTVSSVDVQAPGLSLVGITQPSLPAPLANGGSTTGDGLATFLFDPSGLAPGCYQVTVSSTTSVFDYNGNSNSYTSLTFPVSFTLAVSESSGASLVDPVPELLNGNAVMTDIQLQTHLTKGRIVSGVAADGVTQAIVRIDTSNPGHQFTVTLVNDQGNSGSSTIPNEDGAVGIPGTTSFSLGQVTVTAGSADQYGMAHAFAVYRAPIDFARPIGATTFKTGTCQGVSKTDDQMACRSVSLQVFDVTSNTALATVPVTIVRPPVVLIHGLWGSANSWNSFSPLVTGTGKVDPRFHVERPSYNWDVSTAITSSDPQYPHGTSGAKANSLGVRYLAPFLLGQINGKWFTKFKNGDNPAGIPLAAVQVDVIGHSMGGLLARYLPLVNGFFSNTFGQGLIHKLISVDVPHLGTPVANLMLDPSGGCTRRLMAWVHLFSFRTVTLNNSPGTAVAGAVGDLMGSSQVISAIGAPGSHQLPTALIAGIYTNFSSIDCNFSLLTGTCMAQEIRNQCTPTGDAIANNFNGTDWPLLFGPSGNNANDAVVSQSSQQNGLTLTNGTNGFIYTGLLHSPDLEDLDFTGPSVIDPASSPNPAASQAIVLLNTPYNQAAYISLNP